MTDLAVIIVSWNVREMLAGCLRSVMAELERGELSGQVWVVDNDSADGSAGMVRREFPGLHLIASRRNLGFAAGNNAALRAIGFPEAAPTGRLPEAVLLLNPDTRLHSGALPALVDFLRQTPRAGIVGARLLYGDGTFQHSAFDFPGLWQLAIELLPLPGRLVESRLNGRYPRQRYEAGQPFRVDHPLGAAMCVRREAIQQAGLLDERYHMYVEEVDWSKRIAALGWQSYCLPAAVVTHFGGQSSGQIQSRSFTNLWRSRYRFYGKHYSPLKRWLAGRIVRAGLRRKVRQDAAAHRQGKLSAGQLAERRQCYRQVIEIWQGETFDD